MATSLPSTAWHTIKLHPLPALPQRRRPLLVQSFRRSDIDTFARRMASGEAWKDAWRTANDGFEQFVFEAKKTAERLDRQYSVSRRLSSVVRSATDRVCEIDREFEIGLRWRTFNMDFSRNWPRYRKQLNDLLDTPLGRGFTRKLVNEFLWKVFYVEVLGSRLDVSILNICHMDTAICGTSSHSNCCQ
ncbi:hypothetical protein CRYUN_Cryun16bG0055000 [Craigia yunnanensis]